MLAKACRLGTTIVERHTKTRVIHDQFMIVPAEGGCREQHGRIEFRPVLRIVHTRLERIHVYGCHYMVLFFWLAKVLELER